MIELTSSTAMMLYLCVTLGIVLAVWLYQHYQSRTKKIVLAEQTLLVCEYCHFAYLGDRVKKISQCPQCSLYNKGNRYRKNQ